MHVKIGCDAEGGSRRSGRASAGTRGHMRRSCAKVLERVRRHACGPYRAPAIDIEALAVYTNNPPCARCGFGANQSAFAIENLLNRLAEKVGIDGWEIRWRNILHQGDRFGDRARKLDTSRSELKRDAPWRSKIFMSRRNTPASRAGLRMWASGNGMPDPGWAIVAWRRMARSAFGGRGLNGSGVCSRSRIQISVQETGLPPETFTAFDGYGGGS